MFALLWRLIGINWGLPNDLHAQSYHPDEPVNLLVAQQVDISKGDFEPGFYNYPTLYLTALRVVSDMTSAYTGAPVRFCVTASLPTSTRRRTEFAVRTSFVI